MNKKNTLRFTTVSVRIPKNASPSEIRKAQKELDRILKLANGR